MSDEKIFLVENDEDLLFLQMTMFFFPEHLETIFSEHVTVRCPFGYY